MKKINIERKEEEKTKDIISNVIGRENIYIKKKKSITKI